jgi:hypothetical protein
MMHARLLYGQAHPIPFFESHKSSPMYQQIGALCVSVVILSGLSLARAEDAEPISPKDAPIQLFNGKNLDRLYTWLSDTKYEDPRRLFTVEDGMLHVLGDSKRRQPRFAVKSK